jgi:EAL domain-containing protein (putative c-di-GMP-specific phosphodiesterase class I)
LGDWVLQTACQQLQQWNQAGLTELTMSVNVSTRQLADPNFCQRVKQALQSHALSPEVLEIEITESEALRNEQAGHELLRPLRELGVRIAIDDFGTGYSGLSRLQNLAVDRLKMDQSFVRDLATSANARALSQCFISVGQAMGLEVVAEGVETAEQLEILLAQGFHLVQGFLTGGPMPADEFFAWHQQNIPPVLC